MFDASNMVRPLGAMARISGVGGTLRPGSSGAVSKASPFLLRGPGWTPTPTALYNGVGTRLGEADWNQTVKAFLTDFMATDEIKGIHNIWMKMDAPQLPTEMKGVPFTIAR